MIDTTARHYGYIITKTENATLLSAFQGKCVFTGVEFTTAYYPTARITEGFRAWEAGTLLQHAFPFMSADDREFMKTGISPTGWNSTFTRTQHL